MPNVELAPKHELTILRRVAMGTWRDPCDPTAYGTFAVPMDAALDYIQRFRRETRLPLVTTHLVAKAIASALTEVPDANAVITAGLPRRRAHVDIGFQVLLKDRDPSKTDLTVTTLRAVEKMSLAELVVGFRDGIRRTRAGEDVPMENARRMFGRMPRWLMALALRLMSFLCDGLGWDLSFLGIPKNAMGSVLISNVGTFGLEQAFTPLMHYPRVPLQLAVGKVHNAPAVEHGQVVLRSRMCICASLDHRVLDGVHAGLLAEKLLRFFEDPDRHFGPIDQDLEAPNAPIPFPVAGQR